MIDICSVAVIAIVVVCLVAIGVISHAPEGWEDRDGFHTGRHP